MPKYQPTASDRIRRARLKRQRARAEAERVTRIVAERSFQTTDRLMRENRAGGF